MNFRIVCILMIFYKTISSQNFKNSTYVYKIIRNALIASKDKLADFSTGVFDYTAGSPKYISLWNMLDPKYKDCYKTGFPIVFSLSTIFPAREILSFNGENLIADEVTSNLGLIEYFISEYPHWVQNEQDMPLYHLPNIINLYRFLYNARMNNNELPFLTDYEETMFLYTYVVCRKIGIRQDRDGICPDICGQNTNICGRIEYSLAHTCALVDEGVLENQFTCQCIFGYRWEINLKKCVKKQDIECNWIDKNKYCDKTRTLKCVENFDSAFPKCICHKGYHGDDCTFVNSRCLQPSVDNLSPSGYEACRVLQGGLCNDIAATNYSCICPPHYGHDSNLLYPNCVKVQKRDPCDIIKCLNGGHCVRKSELIGACVCQSGYMGVYCQYPIGTWTLWTRWSNCYPVCGPRRQKYQFRDCLGDTSCNGSMVKTSLCGPFLCGPYQRKYPLNLNTVLHSIFTIDEKYNPMLWMLKYSGTVFGIEILVIIIAGGAFIVLTWLMFIFDQSFRVLIAKIRRNRKPNKNIDASK